MFAKTENQSGRTPTESATILDPASGYATTMNTYNAIQIAFVPARVSGPPWKWGGRHVDVTGASSMCRVNAI